jgi:hypothetical protein
VAKNRRRGQRTDTTTLPWWGWLIAAVICWLIGHMMTGSPPPKSALASVAHRPLNAITLILSYGIAAVCLVKAFAGGVFAILDRRSGSHDQNGDRKADAEETRIEPQWSRNAPDLYDEWKDVGRIDPRISVDTTSWNLALIKALEWKRLEQLTAVYFRTLRFRVEEANFGPDGGVDLRLYSGQSKSVGVLVQCKAWNTWCVGVKEVRELFGVMAAEGVNEGILVTSSWFSKDAIAFAAGKNIALIDGEDLVKKLKNLPPEDQAHILALTTSDDFMTPTCPSCGVKMARRVAQRTGDAFWGCRHYPRCRYTLKISNLQGRGF